MALSRKRYKFQSTLPYGERRGPGVVNILAGVFQSTLPYGERPAVVKENGGFFLFQSTLPYGERPRDQANPAASFPRSIHAPVRGATSALLTYTRYYTYHGISADHPPTVYTKS